MGWKTHPDAVCANVWAFVQGFNCEQGLTWKTWMKGRYSSIENVEKDSLINKT